LIGDPVCYSISDRVYPLLFPEYNVEGEFCKIQIDSASLPSFFENIPQYDFLTVTMPHKKAVVPYLDRLTEDARLIGCVNFISINNGHLLGCNFDGIGALNVIEKELPVFGKKVVVVGAGGAARAAIYEAKKRGALVTCVNRTESKGREVSSHFNVAFAHVVERDYDVLINATSVGMDPGDLRCIVSYPSLVAGKVVLDMASRTGEGLLKRYVIKAGGVYISGSKMFYSLTRASLDYISVESFEHL
jgi:shikimate dehydrogenase